MRPTLEQLCWECANACRCCWVCEAQPIEGWTATPTKIKNSDMDSYLITACPLFKQDRKYKITAPDLAKLLQIGTRTLCRYSSKRIKRLTHKMGYELFIDEPTTEDEHRKYYIVRTTHRGQ